MISLVQVARISPHFSNTIQPEINRANRGIEIDPDRYAVQVKSFYIQQPEQVQDILGDRQLKELEGYTFHFPDNRAFIFQSGKFVLRETAIRT